ncbi:MAG: VCBS repeat-containing protein, partial [Acidobacteria bacterium]|nr:VCBS repeat-containing protein [Acidobacteriota bacterium]
IDIREIGYFPNTVASPGIPAGAFVFATRIDTLPDAQVFEQLGFVDDNPLDEDFPFDPRVVVVARRELVQVTFTDSILRLSILKVCKVQAGLAAGATGANVTFNAQIAPSVAGFFEPDFFAFQSLTIAGGSAAQGGNCRFLNAGLGRFFLGPLAGVQLEDVPILITETSGGGSLVSVTGQSPNTTVSNVNLGARSAQVTVNTPISPGLNEGVVTFVNNAPGSAVATAFDFDGDGKADPSIFTPSNFTWTHRRSTANDNWSMAWGAQGDKTVAGDYDGDGRYDRAIYRPSTGEWYVHTGNTVMYRHWGEATDIPLTGDFDGDGRSDFAVFRPSTGFWYINQSTNGIRAVHFGISGDRPVAADFDGDRKTDIAVYRNGTWYIQATTRGFYGQTFGIASDIPVPADYDGDKSADIAVYRSGTWYYLGSKGTYNTVSFGQAGDRVVAADYDGDGSTDLAVFRPAEGKWLVRKSGQADAAGDVVEYSLGSASDVTIQTP